MPRICLEPIFVQSHDLPLVAFFRVTHAFARAAQTRAARQRSCLLAMTV